MYYLFTILFSTTSKSSIFFSFQAYQNSLILLFQYVGPNVLNFSLFIIYKKSQLSYYFTFFLMASYPSYFYFFLPTMYQLFIKNVSKEVYRTLYGQGEYHFILPFTVLDHIILFGQVYNDSTKNNHNNSILLQYYLYHFI